MEENKTEEKDGMNRTKTMKGKLPIISLTDIINGNFLAKDSSLRQAPFVFFLTGVAMVYIANGYFAERKIREINKITNELKELRSEYINSKSKLMFVSKQSEVAKTAGEMGLEIRESVVSPKKIILE